MWCGLSYYDVLHKMYCTPEAAAEEAVAAQASASEPGAPQPDYVILLLYH